MDEKRKHTRVPIEVEIFCKAKNREGQRGKGTITIYSSNISVGGLFLESSIPFAVSASIYLRFKLPGVEKEIMVEGQIARYRADSSGFSEGMGVEFTRISFQDKLLIEDYIKHYLDTNMPLGDK